MNDNVIPYQGPAEVRIHPHNIEAEQAYLGALLLNNDVLDRTSRLRQEHFYDPVHGRIFAQAAAMINQGALASAVTLKPFLAGDEGLNELDGPAYLTRMVGAAISIIAAKDYADNIIMLAERRELIRIGEEMQGMACDFTDDMSVDDMRASIERRFADLDGEQGHPTNVSFAHASEVALNRANDAYQGVKVAGIDLRIPELSEKLSRLRPGDLLVIGGRPSMGKSAVAAESALACAQDGIGVVYWCGEMTAEDNAERMLASFTTMKGEKVSYRDIAAGRMSEAQFKAVLEGARDLEALPITFIDPKFDNLDRLAFEIRREVARLRRRGLTEVIVYLDYLQIIDVPGLARYELVTKVSKGAKRIAIDLDVPVVALAQLSRKVEEREDKRPKLSDLRESGQIEQDAQNIVFVYRDEYYLQRMKPPADDEKYPVWLAAYEQSKGKMELIIAKQRSGPLGTAHVMFDGATNRITPPVEEGYVQEGLEI